MVWECLGEEFEASIMMYQVIAWLIDTVLRGQDGLETG